MAEKFDYWPTITFFMGSLGIQKKTLLARNVSSRVNAEGHTVYNLQEAVAECEDLLAKRHSTSPEQQAEAAEAKNTKEYEELRKLTLLNDKSDGAALAVSDLKIRNSAAIRSLIDTLDSVPTRVKIQCPDLSQADLALIRKAIAIKRNEAADHRRKS